MAPELDAETLDTLRVYRAAARKVARDWAKVAKRKSSKTAEPTHWTAILASDWSNAGPRLASAYGFTRDQWPPLQRLRNQHGPAILDQLDQLLDRERA